MNQRQRKRQYNRRKTAKVPETQMLDPRWTPQKGYSHAWSILKKLVGP